MDAVGVTNLYDVLDTVAKIGTGGLITGFATYFMMKKNHHHETEKESVKEKKNLLRDCANCLESASSRLNELIMSEKLFGSIDRSEREISENDGKTPVIVPCILK